MDLEVKAQKAFKKLLLVQEKIPPKVFHTSEDFFCSFCLYWKASEHYLFVFLKLSFLKCVASAQNENLFWPLVDVCNPRLVYKVGKINFAKKNTLTSMVHTSKLRHFCILQTSQIENLVNSISCYWDGKLDYFTFTAFTFRKQDR